MASVTPAVYIAQPSGMFVDRDEMYRLLADLGESEWRSDATTDEVFLIEFAGRLCYLSFGNGLNPNITRTRSSSADYIANLLEVNHGSVFEHVNISLVFNNVSRILTHELVRHRVGTAYSQESLRYKRLDLGVDYWETDYLKTLPLGVQIYFNQSMLEYERRVQHFIDMLEIDKMKSFEDKKKATSLSRRLAPEGLATRIFWTFNVRSIRNIILQRTDTAAEEEIRYVFCDLLVPQLIERWPILFGDLEPDANGWYRSKYDRAVKLEKVLKQLLFDSPEETKKHITYHLKEQGVRL